MSMKDDQYDKWKVTMTRKHGSWEKYREFMRETGRKGGLTGSNGILEMTAEEKSAAGKKGMSVMRAKMKAELLKEIQDAE